MNRIDENGLSSPMGNGGAPEPPPGHSRICWASATGEARRGRPPEDYAVSEQRARQLIADGAC